MEVLIEHYLALSTTGANQATFNYIIIASSSYYPITALTRVTRVQ